MQTWLSVELWFDILKGILSIFSQDSGWDGQAPFSNLNVCQKLLFPEPWVLNWSLPSTILRGAKALASVPAQLPGSWLYLLTVGTCFQSSHVLFCFFKFIDHSGFLLCFIVIFPWVFLLLSWKHNYAFKCMFIIFYLSFLCVYSKRFSEYPFQVIAKRGGLFGVPSEYSVSHDKHFI